MTPSIITVDSLARAAETASLGCESEPLRTISFHRRTGFGRSASARRARETLASAFTRAPRSHLPEESTRGLTWRFSRARYELPAGRADGKTTRAAGRRAPESAPEIATRRPGLTLEHHVRAGVGGVSEVVAAAPELADIREVSRSARGHISEALRLLRRSETSGISERRRRSLVRQASEHCREAFAERSWLREHATGLDAETRDRLDRFVNHSGWSEVGGRVSAAMSEHGIATE